MLAHMILDLLTGGGNAWTAWWTSSFADRKAARQFRSAHHATIFDWGYERALRVESS